MRIVMWLILASMLAGLLSPLLVPGSDEQVPPGAPLEEPLKLSKSGFLDVSQDP